MDYLTYMRRRYWKAKGITGNIVRSLYPPFYMMLNKKENFLDGVSANIVTKDDIWLRESITSIIKYVDEIIIVDSSSSKYKEKNEEIVKSLNNEIKIKYVWKDLNITEARNLAQDMSDRSYILHWDGDMIAYNCGEESIEKIFKMLKDREYKNNYYEIFFQFIRMGYSLMTVTDRDTRYHREAWIYSKSKDMRWISKSLPLSIDEKKIDQPVFPLFYKKKILNQVFGLHLHLIQPREKLIVKALYNLWMNPSIKGNFKDYNEFYKAYSGRISDKEIFSIKEFEENNIKIPDILKEYEGKSYDEIMKIKSKEYPWINQST